MRKTIFFFAGLFSFFHGVSQDTHYWSQQFGTRSALLGGAVVAGTRDNTSIFYNPGALGFVDTGSISVNASVYQIQNIKIENAFGQQVEFQSSQLGSVPLLFSGMFRSKNPRLKMGYGFLSPTFFDFKAAARIETDLDVINDQESPGREELTAQQGVNSELKEIAFVFGLGYRLNDKWSVGISNILTNRNHEFIRNWMARGFMNNAGQDLVSTTLQQSFRYWHLRYTAKLGAVYNTKRFGAGLTVTTPGIRLMGKGSVSMDVLSTNIKPEDERINIVANDRQEKLKTTYKSPFSIAAGINYRFARAQASIVGQYFGNVGVYNILQPQAASFVRPADAYPEFTSDQYMGVKQAAKSVFNIALAFEARVSDAVTLQTSVRSDNTYYDKSIMQEVGIKSQITSWDIYHFVMGTTITKRNSSLSLGLMFSTGKDPHKLQSGDLNDAGEGNLLQGATTITKAKYTLLGFLLGYTYQFRRY